MVERRQRLGILWRRLSSTEKDRRPRQRFPSTTWRSPNLENVTSERRIDFIHPGPAGVGFPHKILYHFDLVRLLYSHLTGLSTTIATLV